MKTRTTVYTGKEVTIGYIGISYVAANGARKSLINKMDKVQPIKLTVVEDDATVTVTFQYEHMSKECTEVLRCQKLGKFLVFESPSLFMFSCLHLAGTTFYNNTNKAFYIASAKYKTVLKKMGVASYKSLYLEVIALNPLLDTNFLLKNIETPLPVKPPKKVEKTDSVKYLSEVLKGCPTTTASHRAIHKPSTLPTPSETTSYGMNVRNGNEWLSATLSLQRLRPIREAETFFYPETKAQYIAFLLMMSYTTKFNSCMYLATHDITLKRAKALLTVKALTPPRGLDCSGGIYSLWSVDDFLKGLIMPFFQLGEDGLVEKRFTVFMTDKGYKVSNSYNMSQLDIKVGNMLIDGSNGEPGTVCYEGRAYMNEPNRLSQYVYS